MKIIIQLIKGLSFSLVFACSLITHVLAEPDPLHACVAQIDGLSVTNKKQGGILIDIIKRLDKVYAGKIKIRSYSFSRSIYTTTEGGCDFHVPFVKSSRSDLTFNSRPLTRVAFVIYRKQNFAGEPVISTYGKPIETMLGHSKVFDFKTYEISTEIQGLKRLLKDRSLAFIYAQEPVDKVIAEKKLRGRFTKELYTYFPSAIVLPNNTEHASRIDSILTPLLLEAETHKDYRRLLLKMHSDFKP